MQAESRFRRVLLKLSGEALSGDDGHGISPRSLDNITRQICQVAAAGVQMVVVNGAGNFFRGMPASREGGISRATADHIGMMATIMNALAITEAIRRAGTPAVLQSALHVAGIAPQFHRDKALTALEQGNVVILAGGTGHPFFTTDTTAALRARELDVEVILKATTVDGVYSADPKRVPDAVRYERLAFATALEKDLRVMDATAFSLCREGGVPILVFDFSRPDALSRVLAGTLRECTLVDDGPTVTAP